VLCLFCKNFGREDVAGDKNFRKRKQTTNEKYFCSPWRTDNFLSHHRKQHSAKWVEYENLTCKEKRAYFVYNESEQVINMRSFVEPQYCNWSYRFLTSAANFDGGNEEHVPDVACTRWISMGKLLKWLMEKRTKLLQYFEQKKTSCTPSNEWWIIISLIQPFVERLEQTFIALQGMNTLVSDQRKELSKLANDLQHRVNIEGPLTEEELQSFASALQEIQLNGYISYNFCVKH
jgi:hypothetical protein